MAQVSIVTAARKEAAAAAEQAAPATVVLLNPGAREFLPWWRLESGAKALSVDAPEFVMKPASKGAPPAADAGGADKATATIPSNFRTGRSRAAYRSRRFSSRWQEAVRRTVFVKYIDDIVTEQMLATLFESYGTVVDCRICGDPSKGLRYGFVELQHEEEAYAALSLDWTSIWINPLRVSLSRTAICPINPLYLPQSEAECEMCSRTVYITNIGKIVKGDNLKAFCEAYFGKVCRFKLLDNDRRYTNKAFVEFAEADGAIAALGCGDIFAGGRRIRIFPSKTLIRDNYCYESSSPVLAGSVAKTKQAEPKDVVPENQAKPVDAVPENQTEPKDMVPENQAEAPKDVVPENEAEPVDVVPENQDEPKDVVRENQAEPVDMVLENQAEPKDVVLENQAEPVDMVPEKQAEPKDVVPENGVSTMAS